MSVGLESGEQLPENPTCAMMNRALLISHTLWLIIYIILNKTVLQTTNYAALL